MQQKYLSIITNFGCHYKCPYCIVKQNHLHVPPTTLSGLDHLATMLEAENCNILSISGGGDPLYEYEKHVDWYRKLFRIARHYKVFQDGGLKRPIPIEMHTSYMTDESSFPFYDCDRVVYHPNTIAQLSHIHRTGDEIVRVVFVVTADYTAKDLMDIAAFVHNSSDIDELSFRQFVDDHYQPQHYLEPFLRTWHKTLWWYIEQNDYNLYYAEGKVSTCYHDFANQKGE